MYRPEKLFYKNLLVQSQIKLINKKYCLFIFYILMVTIGYSAQEPSNDKVLLWNEISSYKSDSIGYKKALSLIKNTCIDQYECQKEALLFIITQFERKKFDLNAAIYLAKHTLDLATKENDLQAKRITHAHLFRFYGAQGLKLLEAEHKMKMQEIKRLLGESEFSVSKLFSDYMELLNNVKDKGPLIQIMDSLLLEAEKSNDERTINFILVRLINFKLDLNRYKDAEILIEKLEKTPISNPIKQMEYGLIITTTLGRAHIAMAKGAVVEANEYYQKGLQLCRDEPSLWLEVQTLLNLSKLEFRRGNTMLGQKYLDKAYDSGKDRKIYELLVVICDYNASIAESNSDWKTALKFTKEKQIYNDSVVSRSIDFNLKNFKLEKEKEQLTIQTKNKELELQVNKSQSKVYVLIMISLGMMGLFLFYFLRLEKKTKAKLLVKNKMIQLQTEKLEMLDTVKSRFFANVSHELRTPLTLIKGPIEKIANQNVSLEVKNRMVQMALQNIGYLESMITEILELTKLDLNNLQVKPEDVNLQEFLIRYFCQFDSLSFKNEIKYSYHLDVDVTNKVMIDQTLVRRIIRNLLSNAFKFTNPKGFIHVEAKLELANLIIHVANSGDQIPPSDLAYLFDRYFQSSQNHTSVAGTGIGLAICHEYAEAMGGSISVSSDTPRFSSDLNTVFIVKIPITITDVKLELITNEPEVKSIIIKPHQHTLSENKAHILVVEDNEDVHTFLKMLLEPAYHVSSASNGLEALDQLNTGNIPDMILSDVMMPVMDGFQLLEKVKQSSDFQSIPFLMLTARVAQDDKMKALRIGVDGYLTKPFGEEELLAVIYNTLKNKTARKKYIDEELTHEDGLYNEADQEWLKNFETLVIGNIRNNQLSIDFLAEQMEISPSTFLRQTKKLTGLTPAKYITQVRIQKAYELLQTRKYDNITKVAGAIGYSDVRSLKRNFIEMYGKSPEDYLPN